MNMPITITSTSCSATLVGAYKTDMRRGIGVNGIRLRKSVGTIAVNGKHRGRSKQL